MAVMAKFHYEVVLVALLPPEPSEDMVNICMAVSPASPADTPFHSLLVTH